MTQPTILALTGVAVLAVVVVLVLAVALGRTRRHTAEALARAAAEQEALRERLEELERAGRPPRAAAAEFVITDVGGPAAPEAPVPARIEGRLFADLVLRESVVRAAGWAHGVRRVLSPEVRLRLRTEARRETRRSARRRRADVKEALRQYYARERGDAA